MLGASLLSRLDARDRALFSRLAVGATTSPFRRRTWTTVTHLGGATCTVASAAVPLLVGSPLHHAALQASVTLVVSHLLVQLVKRTVGRPRPARALSCAALIAEPDAFSFPSGHAAAAMSVAFVYGVAYPPCALPLVGAAVIVGCSRVRLGVHYPGDVVIGQVIAIGTGILVVTA
ncbi:MAG: phosphatase PAP2 family protein [Gemmatimonadaceae bacterium]